MISRNCGHWDISSEKHRGRNRDTIPFRANIAISLIGCLSKCQTSVSVMDLLGSLDEKTAAVVVIFMISLSVR